MQWPSFTLNKVMVESDAPSVVVVVTMSRATIKSNMLVIADQFQRDWCFTYTANASII